MMSPQKNNNEGIEKTGEGEWEKKDERASIQAVTAWNRVKDLQPDTILYCCAKGIFLGGSLQRGDLMKVWCVQPRKKRLWVQYVDGRKKWFSPNGVVRYNLRTEPPEKPIGPTARQTMENTGKAII